MKAKRNILLLFVLVLFCQVCTYRNMEDIRPAKGCEPIPGDTVSFNRDIQPILTQHCAVSGCHSGNDPESNFNLEASVAYAQLLEHGSGYVDTINPKNSVVYSALVSKSQPMPPSGRLNQCNIEMIEKWMQQNAKNN